MDSISEFLTWEELATFSGSVAIVGIIVQFTKKLFDKIVKIPTKFYTYIISVIILVLTDYFTGKFSMSYITLDLFDAVLVSLAANGTYHLFSDTNKKI